MSEQLLVVGAGPAGMAAAQSAWENGIKDIVLLEREQKAGGILNQCIHDGFGLVQFGEMISGPEYANRVAEALKKTDVRIFLDTMVTELRRDKTVTAVSRRGVETFHPEAIVLSTGCRERTRGAIAIPGTRPAGIYTAGVAQNLVNCRNIAIGQEIVILGAGDIGLIMARRLTLEGAKVRCVIELQAEPGGLQRNISQCLYDFGIPLYTRHTVTEIQGRERLKGVVISAVDDADHPIPGTEKQISCDTLILSVGLIPENELAQKAGILLDPHSNGVRTADTLETNIEGIFSCGNSRAVLDLADYVTCEGALAGANAARYIKGEPLVIAGQKGSNRMAKGRPKEGDITCILCPNGCCLSWNDGKISGNRCNRGKEFAEEERKCPSRSVTTVLLVEDGTLLPVRTSCRIPKEKVFLVVQFCKRQVLRRSCHSGDVLYANVEGTGADLIAGTDWLARPESHCAW